MSTVMNVPAPAAPAVRVSVHTDDPLDAAGLAVVLRRAGLPPLPRVTGTGGVLVVSARDPERTARWLREHPDRPPTVLITDHIPDDLAGLGVVLAVPFAAAGGSRFTTLVRAIASGQSWDTPDTQHLLAHFRDLARRHRPTGPLSPAEVRLLTLVAEGRSTDEISRATGETPRAVRAALGAVQRRLELRNLNHAVAYALRNGLLP